MSSVSLNPGPSLTYSHNKRKNDLKIFATKSVNQQRTVKINSSQPSKPRKGNSSHANLKKQLPNISSTPSGGKDDRSYNTEETFHNISMAFLSRIMLCFLSLSLPGSDLDLLFSITYTD